MDGDLGERLVRAPQAALQHGAMHIRWPYAGNAAALDDAAVTLLDCFDPPATPQEIADDLVDAVGLDPQVALDTMRNITTKLLGSGHLMVEGLTPLPTSLLAYPPSASP